MAATQRTQAPARYRPRPQSREAVPAAGCALIGRQMIPAHPAVAWLLRAGTAWAKGPAWLVGGTQAAAPPRSSVGSSITRSTGLRFPNSSVAASTVSATRLHSPGQQQPPQRVRHRCTALNEAAVLPRSHGRPSPSPTASRSAMPKREGAAFAFGALHRIAPPIMSTGRLQIAKPSPVPQSAAWSMHPPEKRLNSRDSCAVGMPMPVSRTAKQADPRATHNHPDITDFRELDGVADQVHQHLPQPRRIGLTAPWAARLDVISQTQPFSSAAVDIRSSTSSTQQRTSTVFSSGSSLPDSIRESRGCRPAR